MTIPSAPGEFGTLDALAQHFVTVAATNGWNLTHDGIMAQLRTLQQAMLNNGWTATNSIDFLQTLDINESGQLLYRTPDGTPQVFVPSRTNPNNGNVPWEPGTPTTTGPSTPTLSVYVNMIYQAGLFPTTSLMDLANKALDEGWNTSRFQNELFKTPEYHTAQAPTFEQAIFQAGLTMTATLQSLVDQAVNQNWSADQFLNALRGTQEFKDRAAISYDTILGQYGLDPSKYQDLINQAIAGNYTADEFLYFLKQTPELHQRMSVTYKQTLSQYGLSGDNLQSLIDEAVNKNYTQEEFLFFLRQTPEYRQRFAGIFDPKTGQMVMDESAYLNLEMSLKQLGKQYGYGVTHHDVAVSIRKGITPNLYEERLQALQRLHEYQPSMSSFRATLAARGLVDGTKEFTRREMEQFVTGMANPKWYQVWQETQGRTAAFVSGLTVGGDKDKFTSIARADIMRVLKTLPGQQNEAELQQYFNQISQQFATVLPLAEAKMFGVTKKTLETATVGGKYAQQARIKVERAQGTQQAFTSGPRASSSIGAEEYDVTRPQTA